MCVIIIKERGQALPPADMLCAAATANPHGFGFATERRSYKGLSFDTFMNRLCEVTPDETCIMHFRLATHGSICAANCHPFAAGGLIFAHNGILPIVPDGDMTDSETALRRVIVPALRRNGYDSPAFARAVQRLCGGSRFAMLYRGRLRLFGSYTRVCGYLCSNDRFTYYMRRYSRSAAAV